MYEKTLPRALGEGRGVVGVDGIEVVLLGVEVGVSQPEESDCKGEGIFRFGRSTILNLVSWGSNSTSEEENSRAKSSGDDSMSRIAEVSIIPMIY